MNCPNCGNDCSPRADVCPKCGTSMREVRKKKALGRSLQTFLIHLVIILTLILLSIFVPLPLKWVFVILLVIYILILVCYWELFD